MPRGIIHVRNDRGNETSQILQHRVRTSENLVGKHVKWTLKHAGASFDEIRLVSFVSIYIPQIMSSNQLQSYEIELGQVVQTAPVQAERNDIRGLMLLRESLDLETTAAIDNFYALNFTAVDLELGITFLGTPEIEVNFEFYNEEILKIVPSASAPAVLTCTLQWEVVDSTYW